MENTDKQLSFKFEKGGSLGAKYITRQQINTITIAGKDANLTYKVSDVLNGAYTLKDGGSLSKFAKYIPLKSIVKVQLRDGKNIKPINGYWLKSTAKPIRISKFEGGGNIDLFQDYNNIPKNVNLILEKNIAKFGDEFGAMDFADIKKMQKEVEAKGYTFDYDMDGSIYGLRPINVPLNHLEGYEDEYKNGGDLNNPSRDEFIKKEMENQTLKEKGQNFKKYKVNVYVQDSRGAFPSIEPYFTDNVVEALNFAKETIKKSSSSDKKGNTYWATIDRFVPISKRANVIYAYSELERITENDVNSSKYAKGGVFKKSLKPVYSKLVDYYRTEKIKDWYIKNYPTDDLGNQINNVNTFEDLWNGINNHKNVYTIIGVDDSLIRERLFQNLSLIYDVDYNYVYKKWLENTDDFARGGAIKQSSKIERKVAEVNSLIREAFDNENDPLYVYDPTSTWESPMIYKEVIYRNGRLYIEYYEPHSSFSQIQKEVINKSNMEEDGYPTLLYIAKMYRKAIRKFKSGKYNNEDEDYKNGGRLGSKPKFKVGDMVYSYQNKTEKRPISYIKESSDSTYDHKYKLSLIDGYSNWIDEKSLSNSTMMKDGGSINKSITFKDWKGDIRVGVITEKLPNGYEVLTDNGVALVKDNEIID